MIQFSSTTEATMRTKKLCFDRCFEVRSATSRFLPDTSQFRTTISLPSGTPVDVRAKLMAMLTEAGYGDVAPCDVLVGVTAFSALAGTSYNPVAELARRALSERIPESFSADEVGAMCDSEAIQMAVANDLLED